MSLLGFGIVLGILWWLVIWSSSVLESQPCILRELISFLGWTRPISTLKQTYVPFTLHPEQGKTTSRQFPQCVLAQERQSLSCVAIAYFAVNQRALRSALSQHNCCMRSKCLEWQIILSTFLCQHCSHPQQMEQPDQESRFPRHKLKWYICFKAYLPPN